MNLVPNGEDGHAGPSERLLAKPALLAGRSSVLTAPQRDQHLRPRRATDVPDYLLSPVRLRVRRHTFELPPHPLTAR